MVKLPTINFLTIKIPHSSQFNWNSAKIHQRDLPCYPNFQPQVEDLTKEKVESQREKRKMKLVKGSKKTNKMSRPS